MPLLESQAAKGNVPKALLDRPELPWYYFALLEDFNRLSRARTYHMSGPNPIDIKSILEYNQRVSKESTELFIDLMQELDSLFIEESNKKSKRKSDSSRKTSIKPRR